MRTEQELKALLQKHHEGLTTPDEALLLQQWYARMGEGNETYKALSAADRERMVSNFTHAPRFAPPKQPALVRYLKGWRKVAVAAALVGIVLCSWLLIGNNRLSRFLSGNQPAIAFVQMATGSAEVRQVILPDSSVVWLNAHTTLQYHPDFVNHREVKLNGEALFTVTHDAQHPFTVLVADSIQTTVLGTQFNIRSYDRLKHIQVSVLSGRVQVAQLQSSSILGRLTRNQAIRVDRSNGQYRETEVNAAALTGWRSGQWELKEEGVEELTLLLYNQYGITVLNHRQQPEPIRIDANFTRQQSAKEIISVFSLLAGCKYQWKDSTTVVLY